mgnify:CR=1 FL=1
MRCSRFVASRSSPRPRREIRDALLRGYEQNEDLCFLDEVRRENERLKAAIDAARAEEREAICERMRELAVLYPQRSGRRHILCQLIDEIRARSGARGV